MARITINGVSLDPQIETAHLQSRGLISSDSSKSDYILVQTQGPLTKSQKSELTHTGVELLEYVPENTYICHYKSAELNRVRALPYVAWANIYLNGFKVSPLLHTGGDRKSANLLEVKGLPGTPGQGGQLVDVVMHRDVDPKQFITEVASAAGVDAATLTVSPGKFRLRVDAQRLPRLAALDAVRHVEPVFEKKLWNNVALKIMGCDVVHQTTNLEGQGQIVAVCDTGFDLGDATNVHPAFAGRVLQIYPLGRANGSDPDGHGTHVCGSAVGDGGSSLLGAIRGAAPKAKFVMQSVLDPQGALGGLPNSLTDLFTPPYTNDGARIHSNSWGDSNNSYTDEARDVDAFVWSHRDLVVLFAAGNAGVDKAGNGVVDPASVGSPGTAKNCITVGASENNRPSFEYVDGDTQIATYGQGWPDSYPAVPIADDRLADNPEGIAAFSSRGPTSDGRIKPDVVAPGTAILSTRSRVAGVGNGWGPSPDPLFFYDGGTSMATPLVAGCAAVVRQYLQSSKGIAQPSAALVKALLINAAHNLIGQYSPSEAGTIANINQGFGRIDLAATVGALQDGAVVQFWDEGAALDTGEQQTFQVPVSAMANIVKVTLVWTDPPGETLQNDLDLIVTTARGTVRHGNIAGDSSLFDRRNNVEQVLMHTVAPGDLQIVVRAYRAAIAAQSFALVARVLLA